jgi:hypothetical protein
MVEMYMVFAVGNYGGETLGQRYGLLIGYNLVDETDSAARSAEAILAHPQNIILYHGPDIDTAREAIAHLPGLEKLCEPKSSTN